MTTAPISQSALEGATFLRIWLGFLGLMIATIGGFFLWALRHGQFAHQDRARYLALKAGIPPQPADGTRAPGELEVPHDA